MESVKIGFFVCEEESWRKQDQSIAQVKTMALGCPCFEKENPEVVFFARTIPVPAL
jgi:hypothetical protein